MKYCSHFSTALLTLFFCLTSLYAIVSSSKEKIFSIHRSINENELVYEVYVTKDGFRQFDPVHVFWIMHSKSGTIEALTTLEKKRAYGVIVEFISKDKIIFALKALPKRSITVSRENGAVVTTLFINNEEAIVENIFIKTGPGGPIPPVEYIEVKGKSKLTGKTLTEKILSKRRD